jgi:hypothetical protein
MQLRCPLNFSLKLSSNGCVSLFIYLFICNLFNGWRIRYNTELDRLISEADVARFVKA